MSETSQRYARLADAFAAKVADVPDDRWSSPSPCEGWSARDVVKHVIDAQGMFLGFVGDEIGPSPSVEDDPAGAFAAARAKVQSRLEDPAGAAEEFEGGFFGKSTFEQGVSRFLCFDLVVHNWDLSRAAGLDDRLDPDDVRHLAEAAKGFGDRMRGPGAFGPELPAPEGADEQTKLLAFLGRQT